MQENQGTAWRCANESIFAEGAGTTPTQFIRIHWTACLVLRQRAFITPLLSAIFFSTSSAIILSLSSANFFFFQLSSAIFSNFPLLFFRLLRMQKTAGVPFPAEKELFTQSRWVFVKEVDFAGATRTMVSNRISRSTYIRERGRARGRDLCEEKSKRVKPKRKE